MVPSKPETLTFIYNRLWDAQESMPGSTFIFTKAASPYFKYIEEIAPTTLETDAWAESHLI